MRNGQKIENIVATHKGYSLITLPKEQYCFHLPYYIVGKDENPTTVVVPGTTGSASIPFRETFKYLGQELRLLVMDIPPLIGIRPSPQLGMEILEQFTAPLREKFNLMAYSGGGIGAVEFCREHPKQVNKLVLVASAGLGKEVAWGLRLLSLPILGNLLAKASIRPNIKSVEKSLEKLFHQEVPKGLAEEIFHQRIEFDFEDWKESYLWSLKEGVNFWGQKISVLDDLRQFQIPVFLIRGEYDRIIPGRQKFDFWQKLNSKIKTWTMANCGHWLQYENPEEFSRMVLNFLR